MCEKSHDVCWKIKFKNIKKEPTSLCHFRNLSSLGFNAINLKTFIALGTRKWEKHLLINKQVEHYYFSTTSNWKFPNNKIMFHVFQIKYKIKEINKVK